MTAEEWRRIPSFPDYEVSSLGRVMSYRRRTPRLLAQNGSGEYLTVSLPWEAAPNGWRTVCVHTLVAEAFHGPKPLGLEVRHLNGAAFDNRAENLEYATHRVNLADRIAHGTHPGLTKTHCKNGHVYDAANTHYRPTGKRFCRACNRERARANRTRAAFRAAGIKAA